MALGAQTAVLLAGRGDAAELAVLVDRVDDPVDARVATDGRVRRVDEDDLVELRRGRSRNSTNVGGAKKK